MRDVREEEMCFSTGHAYLPGYTLRGLRRGYTLSQQDKNNKRKSPGIPARQADAATTPATIRNQRPLFHAKAPANLFKMFHSTLLLSSLLSVLAVGDIFRDSFQDEAFSAASWSGLESKSAETWNNYMLQRGFHLFSWPSPSTALPMCATLPSVVIL